MNRNTPSYTVAGQAHDLDLPRKPGHASDEPDLEDYEKSSECYKRQLREGLKLRKADFWISAGLYLLLISVAFVVF